MNSAHKTSLDSQEDSCSSNSPLMSGTEKDVETGNQTAPKRRPQTLCRLVTIYFFLLVFYGLGYLSATGLSKYQNSHQDFAYTPAGDAVKYHKVSYDGELATVNPFRGEPRPELDKAWHDLLINNNIRLSKEELQKMNRTAIELWDGSGYFGQLNVYHHLHCLKFLRQVLHSEYYDVDAPDTPTHVDHCVDDIRQALMCHADTSVVTFDWLPNYRRPWPNFAVDHTCADWETIDSWAAERSFSAFDQKSLVHPQLGLAFPMIDGEIEEISHGPDMHVVFPEDLA